MKQTLLIISFLSAVVCTTLGQDVARKTAQAGNTKPSADLYNEIAHMDSVLFDAFNTQNLDKMKQLFTDDLEFFHDNDGLIRYSQTIKSFQRLFDQNLKLRRELIKGSLEVYPIKDYGAIEVGSHRFCHVENGKDHCGTFKFVHIWQRTGGGWKISRVVSYNH